VPYIVAMGVACEQAVKWREETHKHIQKICQAFHFSFFKNLNQKNHDRIRINNFKESFDNKILSITIKGIDADTLVMAASAHGVCISAGSACNESRQEPSHALIGYGFSEEEAMETIRVSFSNETTLVEAETGGYYLGKIINDLVEI
jgi:cysteine desulfurase